MPPKKKAKTESLPISSTSWQYIDDEDGWTPFAEDDILEIEKHYRTAVSSATTTNLTFNKGFGTKYTFDFGKMTQRNEDTQRTRFICRIASADEYQWEWEDDMKLFVQFFERDGQTIEKLFQTGHGKTMATSELSWNEGFDSRYLFCFECKDGVIAGTQTNEQSGTTRKIRRILKKVPWDVKGFGVSGEKPPVSAETTDVAVSVSKAAAPPHWTDVKTLEKAALGSFDLAQVGLKTEEAGTLIASFHAALPAAKIISISRIQNPLLWSFYALCRENIKQRNSGDAREAFLSYGERSKANMNTICKYGFDVRVAENGALGQGLYFGTSPTYCDVGRCFLNADGSKEIFVCRAAVGSVALGATGLRRPPPKDPKKPTLDLYDSCANSTTDATIRVFFNNSQVYPEYIVRYI